MANHKFRLLGPVTLSKSHKKVLYELLLKNSQEIKNKEIAEEKFVDCFIELYNKYLISDKLKDLVSKCSNNFIKYINYYSVSGTAWFGMDRFYKDTITCLRFKMKTPLIDVYSITTKNDDSELCKYYLPRLNKDEKKLLKSLFCDYIEAYWNSQNFLAEYKTGYDYFPKISTWDQLYKLNPDWYELLYNYLTYGDDGSSESTDDSGNIKVDLLSKTKFDTEINNASSIDDLMKQIISYING